MKKRIGHLILYETMIGALLLCKIYVFDIFNMVDFFPIFVISRSIEILIVLNFWLEVYT